MQITKSTISNWEKGKREPDINMILTLSDFFKVSTDSLLKGNEEIQSPTTTLDQKVCMQYISQLGTTALELAKNYLSLLTKVDVQSEE